MEHCFSAFLFLFMCVVSLSVTAAQNRERARDWGIPFEGQPGPYNTITDVKGVEVGEVTIIRGEGDLNVGKGPVRTGVTAILPRGKTYNPVFAGWYALNGNGEMTGTTWVEESGFLEGPVMITNTHSVGVVRDAVIQWEYENNYYEPLEGVQDLFWALPVVAETYDGVLNDINGFHVKKEHTFEALNKAHSGPVGEGNTGGGTGMICHGFKGGTGTSSRIVKIDDKTYTIGVLVQANYGIQEHLTIAGIPMGREIRVKKSVRKYGEPKSGTGSIIVVVATDAPLLPHQLNRLAERVPLGIAKVGGYGANTSGDIFLAFSTANPGAANRHKNQQIEMLPNDKITPLFVATAQAVEESILNALVAAKTMTGINGNTIYELPKEEVIRLLKEYNRYNKQ